MLTTAAADTPHFGPHGAWTSPLKASALASVALGLAYVTAHQGRLTWIEARPTERGRNVLLMARPGPGPIQPTELIEPFAATFNARSRVHEYGGRPHVAVGDTVLASGYDDQRLYMAGADDALTPPGYRYADGAADAQGIVYLVREDHSQPGEPANAIVALDPRTPSAGRVLFDDADFVAHPRPSADGRLALLAWDHPNMPWDDTRLVVGRLDASGLTDRVVVAGGQGGESVLEPAWDADGSLYFLSDRSGFWGLYRWRGGQVETVLVLDDAELGGPLWVLGLATYALTGAGRALVRVNAGGDHRLAVVDLGSGALRWLALPYVEYDAVGVLDAHTGFAVASSEDGPDELITFDLDTGADTVLRQAGSHVLAAEYVSRAEPITFPTTPGADGAPRMAHSFFHAPCNPRHCGPAGLRPPLIVLLHGGPTANATRALSLAIQYWTTRGFAVVNVNYGGSTGFGRAYRTRLRGQWGVVDLQDAVAAVDFLDRSGRIDGARVAIRGGSAGGYTVLSGLAFTRRFAAGISYYGVADLESLAADTHKFESRYLDTLVAPLPEGRATYRARSPIHHVDGMDAALIAFQGDEDRAVPPEQSRRIVEAVRARGKPVAYIEFKGEQHGFRDAQNIARALEAELYFLGRIFGFTPADAVAPVPIDNLD
jgi:dipeptidyl aminopeptidase/acylaminoacyl peptidase